MLPEVALLQMAGQKAAEYESGRLNDNIDYHVSRRELQRIVDRMTSALGIVNVPGLRIAQAFSAKYTVIWINGDIQIWISRYYVAWQNGAGNVHYVYITRKELEDELCEYRAASRLRGRKIAMPRDIHAEFGRIWNEMRRSGEQIWIDETVQ